MAQKEKEIALGNKLMSEEEEALEIWFLKRVFSRLKLEEKKELTPLYFSVMHAIYLLNLDCLNIHSQRKIITRTIGILAENIFSWNTLPEVTSFDQGNLKKGQAVLYFYPERDEVSLRRKLPAGIYLGVAQETQGFSCRILATLVCQINGASQIVPCQKEDSFLSSFYVDPKKRILIPITSLPSLLERKALTSPLPTKTAA